MSNRSTDPTTALLPFPNPVIHDPVPEVDFRKCLGRVLRMRWEGDHGSLSGRGRFNRECGLRLLSAGDVELTLGQCEVRSAKCEVMSEQGERFAPLFARWGVEFSFPVDVTVRHQVLPDWRRPESGRLIVLAPWVYGHLPQAWREGALDAADEVWAPSRFVRDVYVRSGVPAEKVRVVAPGVDLARFTPDGPAYPLPTRKSVRLLFVGELSARRGADLLLGAYTRAFRPEEDVCLVVRATPPFGFREDAPLWDTFHRAAADPRLPEIVFLEEALSDAELASLYRACHGLVLPYRGVDFGSPVLEAMACGLPVIVTAGGATDDFVDDEIGWRVPYRHCRTTEWTVGPYACMGEPWQPEPDREALVELLRAAVTAPEELRVRGQAARAEVERRWSWERTVAQIRYRLQEVVAPAPDPPFVPAKSWEELSPPGSLARGRDGTLPRAEGELQTQRAAEGRRERDDLTTETRRHGEGHGANLQKRTSSPCSSPCLRVSVVNPSSAALCASSERSERAVNLPYT